MAAHVWQLDYDNYRYGEQWGMVFIHATRAGAVSHLAKLITNDVPAGLTNAALASDMRVLDELCEAGVARRDSQLIGWAKIVSGVCNNDHLCADLLLYDGASLDNEPNRISFGINRMEVMA